MILFNWGTPKKIIIFTLVIVFGLTSFLFGVIFGQSGLSQSTEQKNSNYTFDVRQGVFSTTNTPEFVDKELQFDLYWDVWKALEDKYYKKPIKDAELFYGSLRGLAASLGDPYTVFFSPKEAEEFNQELSGKFEGIGAEIGIKDNRLTIIAPLSDSPAERAGLRPGDKVLMINKEDSSNLTLDEGVKKIRGPKGTTVILNILHKGETTPIDLTLVRDQIIVKSVSWKLVSKTENIAYVDVFSFSEDTVADFTKMVSAVLRKRPKGLILDLRSNPGGFLDAAVRVASFWIEDGVVVREKFADQKEEVYNTEGSAKFKDLKTIVLVNEGSASASEIVAGALKDYNKAIIVGEKTFGKGSVQDYSPLKGGSALKITVAEWLTPRGTSINTTGITPDIEVKRSLEDYNADRDPQLDKAVELLQ